MALSPAKRLRLDWGELAYYETGDVWASRAVVFLHGHACSSAGYWPVLRALNTALPQTRLIALDFRGHGNSAIPTEIFSLSDLSGDVLTLVGTLGLEKIMLVGHSLGGMVALDVSKEVAAVEGLVLLEGWITLEASRAFDSNRHHYGTLPEVTIRTLKTEHAELISRVTPELHVLFWNSVRQFDGSEVLATAEMPIYSVYGDAGRLESARNDLLVPDRSNIRFKWVENAGHYLPLERPEEVASLCREAIQEVWG
jgi:pimeloyl-ACP methyl ester carboxylesterase